MHPHPGAAGRRGGHEGEGEDAAREALLNAGSGRDLAGVVVGAGRRRLRKLLQDNVFFILSKSFRIFFVKLINNSDRAYRMCISLVYS